MFEKENGVFSLSTIDHFLTLKRSKGKIFDAGVLHHVENLSDHELIYAILDVAYEESKTDKIEEIPMIARPVWRNASSDQKLEFNDVVFRKLRTLNVDHPVISCTKGRLQNKKKPDLRTLSQKEVGGPDQNPKFVACKIGT